MVTIDFIPNILAYNINSPRIIISRAFLINKHSSPVTIRNFITHQMELMLKNYYMDIKMLIKNKSSNILFTYTDILISTFNLNYNKLY